MRRLYFDLETSPNIVYTWRVGYKLDIPPDNIIKERRIICVSYKWEHDPKVRTITWDKKQSDADLVKRFAKIAEDADEVIGHNGDRFDIKWLRTRCIIHQVPCMPKFNSVDTLKLAKAGFYFNSNRLDYLGKILGFGGKEDTGGFGLWKGVMDGQAQSLKDMVSYCERDVILLEKVHHSLAAYTPHRTHVGVLNGGYKYHCPKCASDNTKRNRMKVTAMGTTQVQMLCYDCKAARRGGWFTVSQAAYTAYMKEQAANAAKNKV